MAYTTYAQEKAAKDAERARKAKKFRYEPVLLDRMSGVNLEAGAIVVKVQPHGCPRNGTMGMTYVGEADTGKFIGMVCLNSLVPVKQESR